MRLTTAAYLAGNARQRASATITRVLAGAAVLAIIAVLLLVPAAGRQARSPGRGG